MRTTIQKAASVFFLLLSLSPLLTILIFSMKKDSIQFEMRIRLEKYSLQTLIIPEEKVIWIEDHEIWVNESMFDIRTRKLENGVYTFTGMYDGEETALVKKQHQATQEQQNENGLLIQAFSCLKNLYNEPLDCQALTVNEKPSYKPAAIFHREDPVSLIPTPPPQAGLSF